MKNMKRFASLFALLAGLLVTSGCFVSFLTPKTAALQLVHDTYRADFMAFNVPAPAMQAGLASPPAVFSKSLQSIRDYRLKYPSDSQELAHLKVLEGMIYLQSGRFGLAEAVKDDVQTAGARLSSGTGRTVRDRLFAENFPRLIDGWKETTKPNNQKWQTFSNVADSLFRSLTNEPPSKLADPEADQGAIYLANTAAIFDVWAYSLYAVEHGGDPGYNDAATRKMWFTRGRDLIGRFLTPAEKSPQAANDVSQTMEGRLRYVQWYHWLGQSR